MVSRMRTEQIAEPRVRVGGDSFGSLSNVLLLLFQSFFGLNFGGNADIDIVLDGQDERRMAEIKDENGRKERLYLFYDGESVTGKVSCFYEQ